MIVTILLLILGLVVIVKGGDYFVDSSAWIAEVSGIPKLIVGATIVSFATTLPELLVSCLAAFKGNINMAIGNAVGSVTANLGLIMAVGIIFMAMPIRRGDYLKKTILMLGTGVLLFLLSFRGEMKLLPSLILLAVYVYFIFDNVMAASKEVKAEKAKGTDRIRRPIEKGDLPKNIVKFILGLAGISIGAYLLNEYGEKLARDLGVPDRIIAVTIVAVGTSLPELVTMITAIVKKQQDLSFGNIIGANIIDVSLILPVSAIIKGGSLTVADSSAASVLVDIPVMIIAGAIALVPALIFRKFMKWQGFLMLAVFLAYSVLTCMNVFSGVSFY